MTRHDRLFLQPLQPVNRQHELDPLRNPPGERRLKQILNIASSSLVNALLKQIRVRQTRLGLSSAAECSLGKKFLHGKTPKLYNLPHCTSNPYTWTQEQQLHKPCGKSLANQIFKISKLAHSGSGLHSFIDSYNPKAFYSDLIGLPVGWRHSHKSLDQHYWGG